MEEIEAESAASALLLLSKPKEEFDPSKFTSLWEGIYIKHNILTVLSVLSVLNCTLEITRINICVIHSLLE